MQAIRTTSHSISTVLAVLLAALTLVLAGQTPSSSSDAEGTSDAGVVPRVIVGENPGGNVTCAEVFPAGDSESSSRNEWQGGRLRGDLPAGLEVIVGTGTAVSWTSTFPISAVIVKGGSASNVYLYAPNLRADGGLVAPDNASEAPAELGNLTFCWDADPDVSLFELCEQAAQDIGPIVSFAGPMTIRDGVVDLTTLPVGHQLTFDQPNGRVGFSAPFPVVAAVTVNSDPITHRMDTPATTGSVPFESDSDTGEVVLCGLEGASVVSLSCAQVGADLELGPLRISSALLDVATLQPPIRSIVLNSTTFEFETEELVAGVMVTASDPVLHVFEPAVTAGAVPLSLAPEGEADIVFCMRSASVPPNGGGSGGAGDITTFALEEVADPTEIASGGGPSTRTSIVLISLVLLALAGWTQLLPRLRD